MKNISKEQDGLVNLFLDCLVDLSKEELNELIKFGEVFKKEIKPILKKISNIDSAYGTPIEYEIFIPLDYKYYPKIGDLIEKAKYEKKVFSYDKQLISFVGRKYQLTPGRTYRIKLFPIIKKQTGEEKLNFLKNQKAILLNEQGLTVVYDFTNNLFPRDKIVISFGEEERLLKDVDGCDMVPFIYQSFGGGFKFGLIPFDSDLTDQYLLCICKLPIS
ncbi:MAG: hypothetical protein WCX46_02900 [Candidatus Paceibacterota bacterium]